MQFEPKTEKQIAESRLWPAGEYSFEIVSAEDRRSKAGNDMIAVKLKVFNDEGKFTLVDDYLMAAMEYKLRHAAVACGLEKQYNAGSLVGEDFQGKVGRLKLFIQKNNDPQYSDKNAVKDYVVDDTPQEAKVATAQKADAKAGAFIDDSIPFDIANI